MTRDEIISIVDDCAYKGGWRINVGAELNGGRLYVQVSVDESATASICAQGFHVAPWKSGKRYLSEHMCRQEVVGAVFGLIMDAEMHECREWFRYKGASIYNPHLDPDVLVAVAKRKASFNVRENAMSMYEK